MEKTVELGIRKDTEWNEFIVWVKINGKLDEGPTAHIPISYGETQFALEEAQAALTVTYLWALRTYSAEGLVKIRGDKRYTDKVKRELGLD